MMTSDAKPLHLRRRRQVRLPVSKTLGLAAVGLVAVCLTACGGPRSPVYFGSGWETMPVPRPSPPPYAVEVAQGDTVYRIARREGVQLRALIDANGLQAPYRLSPGDRLVVPRPLAVTVRRGDTLYGLASRYSLDLHLLAALNDLEEPYLIRVGDTLKLPHKPTGAAARPERRPPRGSSPVPSVPSIPTAAPRVAVGSPLPSVIAVAARPVAAPARELTRAAAGNVSATPVRPPTLGRVDTAAPASAHGFIWPLTGDIVSTFGPKEGGYYNDGINIAAPAGTPIRAAADGLVVYAGDELANFGKLVLLKHPNGLVTAYAHARDIKVDQGERVKRGDIVATVGATGMVDLPQLHFEVRRGGRPQDPRRFLSS